MEHEYFSVIDGQLPQLNHMLVQGIHDSEELFNLLALDLLYDGLGFDLKIVHHEQRSLVVVHCVRDSCHIQLAT